MVNLRFHIPMVNLRFHIPMINLDSTYQWLT